jgi:hypothetical protein
VLHRHLLSAKVQDEGDNAKISSRALTAIAAGVLFRRIGTAD